jgi:hypothetical protein
MWNRNLVRALALSSLLVVSACGGGGSGTTEISPSPVSNTAPVANAGVEQSLLTGTLATLDGSGSSDVDNNTLTYSWSLSTKPTGSSASLSSTNGVKPTFVADKAGTYIASLTVNDGQINSNAVTVTITASQNNAAPVANAGTNQSVVTGTAVTLDGSASSDANGDALTYSWSLISKPTGSNATLSLPATARPTLTPDVAGTYVASLTVNDGQVNSTSANVSLTASRTNAAPVAIAGSNQSVVTGAVITLDGSSSSDANGDALTYNWSLTSKPTGSSAALSLAISVRPTFTADVSGTYVASLTVNDGQVNSNTAAVSLTASQANIAPIANAGSTQNVLVGATTTLNGSNSSDANGDSITYAWSLVSKPSNSSATLTNAATVNPTFVPDIAGSYVLRLIVSDGSLSSTATTVTITASTANIAPVANAGASQSVVTGTQVTLNGSASNDANGDTLTYAWSFVSKPTGSSASLSSSTSVSPTFTAGAVGSYVLSLVVNDGTLSSTASTVTITASNANLAPVALAGGSLNVYVGTTITLNGTGSYDPNGDSLAYAWGFVSKPAGSLASLTGATTATPIFTADTVGSYVIALVVGDGRLASPISTVTISASAVPVTSGVSLYLYGGANNSVYLGCLTCNQFHAESVCNNFGTYGNSFNSSSIWNQFGTYGSSFQSYSPWNSFSTSGPIIVGSNGISYGYFTTNAFKSNRTTIQYLTNILNYYSSSNNLASTRYYACGN